MFVLIFVFLMKKKAQTALTFVEFEFNCRHMNDPRYDFQVPTTASKKLVRNLIIKKALYKLKKLIHHINKFLNTIIGS